MWKFVTSLDLSPFYEAIEAVKSGKGRDTVDPRILLMFAAFRQRMKTPEAKVIYAERCSTAELPNAGCRNRGLHQFLVRGLLKAKSVALLHALAHNFQMIVYHGWVNVLCAG